MTEPSRTSQNLVSRFFSGLRFPYLFLLSGLLFVIDLMVPDMIPFVDELILGINTLVLASWKRRKAERKQESAAEAETEGSGEKAG